MMVLRSSLDFIGSRLLRLLALCALTLVMLTQTGFARQIVETDLIRVEVEALAGFNHPWGMAMLPNGDILVTERRGKLWRVDANGKKREITGLPKIGAVGQGGLLDIAADPDFDKTGRVFFTFSEPGKGGVGTALASAQFEGMHLKNLKILFSMERKTSSGHHFGSRIVFGEDDTIFVTTGDRGERDRAQDRFDHAGSVIRIHRSGSIPADNPFADGKNGLPEIWSIGHRNIQGAARHPQSGKLFTVEHGARGGDEINAPKPGRNYGWPVISYGRHYSGAKIGVGTHKAGMEQPLYYWDPSIAPSGMAFVPDDGPDDKFAQWKGNLFVGALRHEKLVRLAFENGRLEPVEILFEGLFGRIRDVLFFADGNLYLLSDAPNGALIRISPAD